MYVSVSGILWFGYEMPLKKKAAVLMTCPQLVHPILEKWLDAEDPDPDPVHSHADGCFGRQWKSGGRARLEGVHHWGYALRRQACLESCVIHLCV